MFNLFYVPVYLVIIKENSINSGASDQFPTAISRIWFLFCQHVIQLSFIFCVHGLSAWVWTFVFCELNISLLKWSISSLAPSPTLCVDYLWGGELGILWDARFEFLFQCYTVASIWIMMFLLTVLFFWNSSIDYFFLY